MYKNQNNYHLDKNQEYFFFLILAVIPQMKKLGERMIKMQSLILMHVRNIKSCRDQQHPVRSEGMEK